MSTFSEALELLKQGKKVARSSWNGKGMFVFLVLGSTFKVTRAPLLCMRTADNQTVPWLASQTDILANDWEELNDS